jgi:hypothetical protein
MTLGSVASYLALLVAASLTPVVQAGCSQVAIPSGKYWAAQFWNGPACTGKVQQESGGIYGTCIAMESGIANNVQSIVFNFHNAKFIGEPTAWSSCAYPLRELHPRRVL